MNTNGPINAFNIIVPQDILHSYVSEEQNSLVFANEKIETYHHIHHDKIHFGYVLDFFMLRKRLLQSCFKERGRESECVGN